MSSLLIKIFCFAGLVSHVSIITVEYMKYSATSSINMRLPDEIKIPALSACFQYASLVNTTRYNIDHGTNLPLNTNEIEKRLTFRQIFDYTPSVDEIFE